MNAIEKLDDVAVSILTGKSDDPEMTVGLLVTTLLPFNRVTRVLSPYNFLVYFWSNLFTPHRT